MGSDPIYRHGEIMKQSKKIEKLVGNFQVKMAPQARRRMLEDMLRAHSNKWGLTPFSIGAIMKSNLARVAAAAVVAIVAIGLFVHFGGESTSAFAKTLAMMQRQGFTCKISVEVTQSQYKEGVIDANLAVLEPGRARTEFAGITTVLDMKAEKSLILWHSRKAAMVDRSDFLNLSEGGLLAAFRNPVENLWGLKDGTETVVGRQQVEGHDAIGYHIVYQGKLANQDLTIWADAATNAPILVTAALSDPNGSGVTDTLTLKDFNFNPQLDESLFSTEVPQGYTAVNSRGLAELNNSSGWPEADSVVAAMTLWGQGSKEQAIDGILKVDLTKPIVFGRRPYIFSMTEKEYISLTPEAQKEEFDEFNSSARSLREITIELGALAKAAGEKGDFARAEKLLNCGMGLGKILSRDDLMTITRMVGIAIRTKMATTMTELYTQTGDAAKLEAAKKELEAAKADHQAIKDKARGM
jgi:outer membrane lipoprotein-sorting protein